MHIRSANVIRVSKAHNYAVKTIFWRLGSDKWACTSWEMNFQHPSTKNSSRNDLPQNHKPFCHCYPRQHRNLWARWLYRSLKHSEEDSTDNTVHTQRTLKGDGMAHPLFSWMQVLLHNCQNTGLCHLSHRELSNVVYGECLKQYWWYTNYLGWMENNWLDRPHRTMVGRWMVVVGGGVVVGGVWGWGCGGVELQCFIVVCLISHHIILTTNKANQLENEDMPRPNKTTKTHVRILWDIL